MGDYNFNLEYYGYLVPIIVYLLTLLLKSSNLLVPLLEEITQLSNAGEIEITYMIRYIVLNFYIAALVLVFYRHLLKIDSKMKVALFCALLYLVPSFNGHALFNIKDIPFALHYFLCVLVIINYPIEKVTINRPNIMKLVYFGVIFALSWFVIFAITKFSSLSSLIASVSVPLYLLVTGQFKDIFFFIIMFVLIFFTHRENIKRLKNKEETKTKIY